MSLLKNKKKSQKFAILEKITSIITSTFMKLAVAPSFIDIQEKNNYN